MQRDSPEPFLKVIRQNNNLMENEIFPEFLAVFHGKSGGEMDDGGAQRGI